MTQIAQAEARGGQWLPVLLILGAGVVSAFQVGKAPLALGMVQADLGLGLAGASWLISAFGLIGALAGAPMGLLVDRLGARRLLLAGLLLLAAGSGLGAVSTGAVPLIATRILEGFGFLAVIVASPALVVAIAAPSVRDRAVALWSTFMPVGMTLVMLGAPLLTMLHWRGFWLLNAALLLAGAAVCAMLLRPAPPSDAPPRAIGEDIREAAGAPGPWGLAGIFTAFSAIFFAIFSFLPMLLDERFATGPELAGMLAAIAVAASAAGNLACGQLLARGFRHLHLLVFSFAIMALGGFAVLSEGAPFALAYGAALLFAFAAGLIPVIVIDSVPRFVPRPDLAGVTIGFVTQGNGIGMLVGPVLAGTLAANAGWTSVALVLALAAISATVLARFLFRRAQAYPAL
jgi:MFS transporter, DHA1 family, inner membrane transport protein